MDHSIFHKEPTGIEAKIKGTLAFASDFTFGNHKNTLLHQLQTTKYEIRKLILKDRKFVGGNSVVKEDWVIFINSCDLQGDGDIDILEFWIR